MFRRSSLLAATFALAACSISAPDRFVDLSVDDVLSIGWSEGGGVYRLIKRNTEIDPCLTLESIAYSGVTTDAISSVHLCTMRTPERAYNLMNTAYVGYQNIRWQDGAFRVRLEYMQRTGVGEELFECFIDALETKPVMMCVRSE